MAGCWDNSGGRSLLHWSSLRHCKNKSLPFQFHEIPGTFFSQTCKFTALINHQIRERENHTCTRTHKKTCVHAHTRTRVTHTHACIPLFFKFTHASSSKHFVSSLMSKLGERGNVCKILFGPNVLNPMFGWQKMISKSERTFFFSTEKEVQHFCKHSFPKHIHSS